LQQRGFGLKEKGVVGEKIQGGEIYDDGKGKAVEVERI
jgi:hypothetical protein